MELSEVKNYLRITHTVDDEYITRLITFAEKFIEEQTGVKYNEQDDVYKIAILQTIAHFYDKRESVSEKTAQNVPFTMDCLIKHIGLRGALEDEERRT